MQKKKERQAEAEHKGQREVAVEARAANVQAANAQRAVDQRTALKPQLLTGQTLETETGPDDYKLFLAKWERYRDSCLKPHNHDASGKHYSYATAVPRTSRLSSEATALETSPQSLRW